MAGRQLRSTLDRLMSRVDKSAERGCWIWTGAKSSKGYGQIWDLATQGPVYVHRFAYESRFGPIPQGLQLDHVCRVRCCCNPEHLRAVSVRENQLADGSLSLSKLNALKTHCLRGHPFTNENTAYWKGNQRSCLSCSREKDRSRYPQRKAWRMAKRMQVQVTA